MRRTLVNDRPSALEVSESIAVVIPVYNGAAYLGEAIESVLAQTLRASEIVVVDDGSSDGSVELAGSYAGVRVVVQANAGVSTSRNNGVALTSATWVAFLDQDDVWDVHKLQRQMEAIRARPDADVCMTEQRYLHADAATGVFTAGPAISLPPADEIGPSLYKDLRFVPSCAMIRRSAFDAAGGFESLAQPCEDWDLWLRLEQRGARFAVCHEPLLLYRYHSSNGSLNGRKMYLGELRAYDRHIGPRLHPVHRFFDRRRAKSRFMAGLALVEREQNRPHLWHMLRSLATFPWGYWKRYKMLTHMLARKMHLIR